MEEEVNAISLWSVGNRKYSGRKYKTKGAGENVTIDNFTI